MRKALHPVNGNKVTVPEFIKEFGNDKLLASELPVCPHCNQKLTVVSPSAPNSVQHFRHLPKSGFCPTKNTSGSPYLNLPPSKPDGESAQQIKRSFVINWQKHFSMLNYLVKGLDIKEFCAVIEIATQERIWEYKELQEFQLPYIFATLKDYPPRDSFKMMGVPVRQKWFRCWFDASVQRYDDLWIHRTGSLLFWRAWYDIQKGKRKPSIEDMIDAYSMELDATFLSRQESLHPYVVKMISPFIEKHFRNIEVTPSQTA